MFFTTSVLCLANEDKPHACSKNLDTHKDETATLEDADENKSHICFKTLDGNKDEAVTFKEFENYYGNDKQKFDGVDEDGNGTLSHDEYHGALGHGSL